MIFMKNAARPGSEGGNGSTQLVYANTTGRLAQPHCTPMPDRCATTAQGAVQLRLFALDGVLSEPYVPARAKGNVAATAATMRVGRAQ